MNSGRKIISFSNEDRFIVREAIRSVLTHDEATLIIMRFWENILPHEIADHLHVRTTWVLNALETAQRKLKTFCLNHPEFSRSILGNFSDNAMKAA